jgi:hypothetical protein
VSSFSGSEVGVARYPSVALRSILPVVSSASRCDARSMIVVVVVHPYVQRFPPMVNPA